MMESLSSRENEATYTSSTVLLPCLLVHWFNFMTHVNVRDVATVSVG